MNPLPLLVAALAVVVTLLFAYLFYRFRKSDIAALETTRREVEAAANARAQAEIQRVHEEHAKRIDSERLRVRAEIETEMDEERRDLRTQRQKVEQRAQTLQTRTQRLAERESLLQQATDAVDGLRREAETLQTRAQRLHTTLQSLHGEARLKRDEADRRERDAERREREATDLHERLERQAAHHEAEAERHRLAADDLAGKLEVVSGITRQEARDALLAQMADEAKLEAASLVKEIRDEAKLRATREAKHIILTAIQRTASGLAIENTVSVVQLASEEMKGRIIGKEGRNIRSFEMATGLEVIVDDTPESVVLSGFDPVRREIGRIALTKLLADGRIHPARIEEVVEKVRQEMEEELVETGEKTAVELNLANLHPDVIRMIGRMKYRTSYGQNLLAHSVETARLASLMAAELGLDATRARRAGLLHDIGKVVEEELEQPHAIVGMELLARYKEHPDVLNAVGAHHDEIEMTAMIAPIVQAADAVSGARPGARREALDAYIKRLSQLEETARSFRGVDRAYAIQAGREVRVLVNHTLVTDALAEQLAHDISKKIETEMQYPGQVKVTVIREVRSVAIAK